MRLPQVALQPVIRLQRCLGPPRSRVQLHEQRDARLRSGSRLHRPFCIREGGLDVARLRFQADKLLQGVQEGLPQSQPFAFQCLYRGEAGHEVARVEFDGTDKMDVPLRRVFRCPRVAPCRLERLHV